MGPGDRHRPRRDASSRASPPGPPETLVHEAHVREARREAEHEHRVVPTRVQLDHRAARESARGRDLFEILAVVENRNLDQASGRIRGGKVAGEGEQPVAELRAGGHPTVVDHEQARVKVGNGLEDALEGRLAQTFVEGPHPPHRLFVERSPEFHGHRAVADGENPRVRIDHLPKRARGVRELGLSLPRLRGPAGPPGRSRWRSGCRHAGRVSAATLTVGTIAGRDLAVPGDRHRLPRRGLAALVAGPGSAALRAGRHQPRRPGPRSPHPRRQFPMRAAALKTSELARPTRVTPPPRRRTPRAMARARFSFFTAWL